MHPAVAAAANEIDKASILSLFRRCIRSAWRIPDPNQRASYLIYIRDGFDRGARSLPKSREALSAYRDGTEQVEQMEYYHSLMKRKKEEKNPTTLDAPSEKRGLDSASSETKNPTALDASNETRLDPAPFDDGARNDELPIQKWLLRHLPHLHREDATKYARRLVDDGFDTVAFMEEELLEEDISFMKKAHRRVIARKLR